MQPFAKPSLATTHCMQFRNQRTYGILGENAHHFLMDILTYDFYRYQVVQFLDKPDASMNSNE